MTGCRHLSWKRDRKNSLCPLAGSVQNMLLSVSTVNHKTHQPIAETVTG